MERRRTIPKDQVNYGEAQDLPIWQVSRAATAAPTYFEPLEVTIEGEGDFLFQDGGFLLANNPSVVGKKEIRNLYGDRHLDIAVSVGTARKEVQGARMSGFGVIESLADAATNVVAAHQEMESTSREEHFEYFRFNAEGKHSLQTLMDEWKPKALKAKLTNTETGCKTLKNIRDAYANWYRDTPRITEEFQACARALVRKRRLRASQATRGRWEAYALGTFYKCNIRGCSLRRDLRRETFEKHLRKAHRVGENQLLEVISEQEKGWKYRGPPSPP